MDEMKKAALDLPGGQVSLGQAIELEEMLDQETEKRRWAIFAILLRPQPDI